MKKYRETKIERRKRLLRERDEIFDRLGRVHFINSELASLAIFPTIALDMIEARKFVQQANETLHAAWAATEKKLVED